MPDRSSGLSIPTVAEVRSICRIEDDLVRNLRITECYHRLSAAFAAVRVGPGANWCTFATWASRQAGCTIRGEDLIDRLRPGTPRIWRALLRAGVLNPRTVPGWIVRHVHTPFDAVEHASRSVAKGNLKVFEEIGEVFAAALADPAFVPEAPRLRSAFEHYARSAVEPHEDRRAWMMLLGNIECGLHEQTRLQPEIESAMVAPLATLQELTWRYLPILKRPVRRLAELLTDLTCEVVSQGFMTLKLPGGRRLSLASDLAEPVPACFEGVEAEPLIAQFAMAGWGGVGAENWADLQQRMRYIARLFQCFHHDKSLFQPPFTAEQRAAMEKGQLPRGAL